MRIAEERHGRVVVLVPSGDMDLGTLPTFEGRVDALIAAGVRVLLWDLGEVRLLPSAAIGFLLQAARRLGACGGRMALCRVGRLARGTLRTMGIGGLFATFDTREAAIAALTSPEDEEA